MTFPVVKQVFHLWSGRRDSNPRRLAWEASTLPLSYARSVRAIITNYEANLDWTSLAGIALIGDKGHLDC